MLTLFLSTVALAQSNNAFRVHTGPLLQPSDLSWGLQSTIGSPAVIRDEATDTVGTTYDILLMVYETQTAGTSDGCPVGEWGVGLAYSFDGTNWSDAGAIVPPGDKYYTCVAAHPSIVSLGTGTDWAIFFKAEQDPTGCTSTAWGCDRYTGVGRLALQYVGSTGPGSFEYSLTDTAVEPVMQSVAQDMGYPSVMYAAGNYHMAFAQNPDVYIVSSPFTTLFSAPGAPVITAGTSASGWEDDELFSPSILCHTSTSFKLYAGGRDFDPYPTLDNQSTGGFSSTDLTTWTEIADDYHNLKDDGFEVRHLDMTTSGTGNRYGAYHTRRIGGTNEVWLSSTNQFRWYNIQDKRCP